MTRCLNLTMPSSQDTSDPRTWVTRIASRPLGPLLSDSSVNRMPTPPQWAADLYPNTSFFRDDVIFHVARIAYYGGKFITLGTVDGVRI